MNGISVENRGDATFHATSRGYGFVIGPNGANPGDTLLAGLSACIGHYVRQFFRERGIASSGFTVVAEADSTADESRLAGIAVRIDTGRTLLDAAAAKDLLEYAARCKIYRTLTAACPVKLTVADGEPSETASR